MIFKTQLEDLELELINSAKEVKPGSEAMDKHIEQIGKVEAIRRANSEAEIHKAEAKIKKAEAESKKASDEARRKAEMKMKIMDVSKAGAYLGASLLCFLITARIEVGGSLRHKGIISGNMVKDLLKSGER